MLRTRTSLLALVALLIGAVVGAGSATGLALALDDPPTAKAAKAVKVCITKQKVVRSAAADGQCPAGTRKQQVAAKGPRGAQGAAGAQGATGPAGLGAQTSSYNQAPDDVVRPLALSLSLDCQADVDTRVRIVNLSDGDAQGLAANDPGNVDRAFAFTDTILVTSGRDYFHGDLVGTNLSTGRLEQVSLTVTWRGSLQACEVFVVRTPLG